MVLVATPLRLPSSLLPLQLLRQHALNSHPHTATHHTHLAATPRQQERLAPHPTKMDPNATKPLDISNNNNQQQLRRGSSLDASMAAGRRDSMDSGAFMQEAAGSRASSFDGGSSTGTRPSLLGEGGKGAWKEARAKKWGLTQPDSATAFWSA